MPADNTERCHAERAHDELNQSVKQNNDAAIKSSEAAIKTTILANGGAIVAVLAFLGNIGGREGVTASQLASAATSLVWFAGGVGAGLLAMLAAYLTNLYNANYQISLTRTWTHPYFVDGPKTCRYDLLSSAFHILAFVAGFASLALFFWGILDVRTAIVQLVSETKELNVDSITPRREYKDQINASLEKWPAVSATHGCTRPLAQNALAVGRTITSLTSTSSGCSMA